jgi:hypothetical protein
MTRLGLSWRAWRSPSTIPRPSPMLRRGRGRRRIGPPTRRQLRCSPMTACSRVSFAWAMSRSAVAACCCWWSLLVWSCFRLESWWGERPSPHKPWQRPKRGTKSASSTRSERLGGWCCDRRRTTRMVRKLLPRTAPRMPQVRPMPRRVTSPRALCTTPLCRLTWVLWWWTRRGMPCCPKGRGRRAWCAGARKKARPNRRPFHVCGRPIGEVTAKRRSPAAWRRSGRASAISACGASSVSVLAALGVRAWRAGRYGSCDRLVARWCRATAESIWEAPSDRFDACVSYMFFTFV